MERKIDLRNDSIKKLVNYYLYSSIIGMVLKSTHMLLDGIFVGNGIGPEGLAAINIIMPVFMFLTAVAMMVGIGSSTLISIKCGEGDYDHAQRIFNQALVIAFASTVISQIVFLLNAEMFCRLLGANDNVLQGTMDYGRMIAWFMPFIVIGMTLSVIVRNDGNPKTSMYGMVASAIVNIILNYVFIFILKMGLLGAGLATGIAQVVNIAILSMHFIRKKGVLKFDFKGFYFSKDDFIRVAQIGMPSFIGDIVFGLVDLSFNRVLISMGGEMAVAAFSIIMYAKTLVTMTFQGIGQAIQPIISFSFGAKRYDRVYEGYHRGVKLGLSIALITTAVGIFNIEAFVGLFDKGNPQVVAMASRGIKYMLITIAFSAYNTCMGVYFQSIGHARTSTIMVMTRSVFCEFGTLMLLSTILGIDGVWLAFPISEVLFWIIGIYLLKSKQDIINKVY